MYIFPHFNTISMSAFSNPSGGGGGGGGSAWGREYPVFPIYLQSCCCVTTNFVCVQDEDLDDENFVTARNTMLQTAVGNSGTMISAGGAADDTITDLGTLVIVGEPDDAEELDTMKSELAGRKGRGKIEGGGKRERECVCVHTYYT